MTNSRGYKSLPLSFTRKMVIASANVNKKNAIHCLTRIDVTNARKKIKQLKVNEGKTLSFTGYIVSCLGETIKEFPEMNAFIKRRKIIILDEITISVLIERKLDGHSVPEPLAIHRVSEKNLEEITTEIRQAQNHSGNRMGDFNNAAWIRFIPSILLKSFIRIADRNIRMAKKYGKIAVTAVGMFSDAPLWFVPHGTATILLTVGNIQEENDREILNLTASFDHELIDGAPASRFISRFSEIVSSASLLN